MTSINSASFIYLGSTAIDKVYAGSHEVWAPEIPHINSLADLFSGSENGAWYDIQDMTTLWQDAAGTIPVTADGDPVGRVDDKSGNENHALQSTAASRPLFRTLIGKNWLEFDGVDDNLNIGPSSGEVDNLQTFIGTRHAVLHGKTKFSNGQYPLFGGYSKSYSFWEKVYQIVLTKRDLSDAEVAITKTLFGDIGVHDSLNASTYTHQYHSFFRSDLKWTHLFLGDFDTTNSGGTACYLMTREQNNLEHLDISSWDFSHITPSKRHINPFGISNKSLVNVVTGPNGEPFNGMGSHRNSLAFTNCKLSQESIDGILLGLVNSGSTGGSLTYTSETDTNAAQPPSATGEGYIDTLRARGWTISVVGGY